MRCLNNVGVTVITQEMMLEITKSATFDSNETGVIIMYNTSNSSGLYGLISSARSHQWLAGA